MMPRASRSLSRADSVLSPTPPELEKLGFRPGKVHAFLAGVLEVGGGLLLALGLLTPFGSAATVAVMVVAAVAVHGRNGFFLQTNGFEYTFVIGGAALALAFSGPGRYAFDAALGLGWSGWAWGLAALVAGLVGAAASLATRATGAPVASSLSA